MPARERQAPIDASPNDALSSLLHGQPSPGLIHDIAAVSMDYWYPAQDFSTYLGCLDAAVVLEPPPFGTFEYGQIYRTAAVDPRWMAVSVLTNAQREGEGATRLWSLAACAQDFEHKDLLKRHAWDESRHSLNYLTLMKLSFPGALSPEFATSLRQLSPRFSMADEPVPVSESGFARTPTLDDFLQMNIAEIRTAIHHTLQRPMLSSHVPDRNRSKIKRLQDDLLSDELRHIAYTGALIERMAFGLDTEDLLRLFRRRLRIQRYDYGRTRRKRRRARPNLRRSSG